MVQQQRGSFRRTQTCKRCLTMLCNTQRRHLLVTYCLQNIHCQELWLANALVSEYLLGHLSIFRLRHLRIMSTKMACMSGLVLYQPICSDPAPDPAGSPHQPNCQWRRANRLMNDNKQSTSSNIASLNLTNIISQNMSTIKMMNQRDELVNLKFRIL